MLGKIISPEQSKTKVNIVVVVDVRISKECRRRCRPRRRRHRCRRRRRSFLCSIWRLSIRLRPDKKESRRNLPKMKRHLLLARNLLRYKGGLMAIGRRPTGDKIEVVTTF